MSILGDGLQQLHNRGVERVPPNEGINRVVGKRISPTPGQPPSAEARQAMTVMANYRTAVPKGVFKYRSHEAANADWERWQADAIKRKTESNSK